jgi:N-methylhydantoinase A
MNVRIAVDIGGTFTDATLIDEERPRRDREDADDAGRPVGGVHARGRPRAREAGVDAPQVGFVVHATTVATNAIIEGKVARSGFVTTEGFRDLLEIARQVRPSLYDTHFEKPKPLVPRDRAVGVRERLGPAGEVLVPLDESSARAAAALLKREGVESVAVCLLHSYVNGDHERRIGAILAEELPGVRSRCPRRWRRSSASTCARRRP